MPNNSPTSRLIESNLQLPAYSPSLHSIDLQNSLVTNNTICTSLGSNWEVTFAEQWLKNLTQNPENLSTFKRIKEILEGNTLIDLGAGNYFKSAGYMIADMMGCVAYIAIDKFLDESHDSNQLSPAIKFKKMDMFDYLANLSPDRYYFTINGIDDFVIRSRDYHIALASELTRLCLPGSLLFGECSSVFRWLDTSKGDWINLTQEILDPESRVLLRS